MSTSNFSPSQPAQPAFFVVAVPKLIVMTLFTLGLYWLFWSLRNWDLYRNSSDRRVMFLPRVLLPELFLYSLLHRVDRRIRASGRSYRWSPWWLTFGVLLMGISSLCLWMAVLPLPELASAVLVTVVLFHVFQCRVQRAINFCEGDPEGAGNAQLTVINWLWILIVSSGWLVLGGLPGEDGGLFEEEAA
ncbi:MULTISPECIES: hypothetical protein [unclassified Pseudomonas]|jgi:hypothetical protein|uniref:hypothetical protein n=1 Tax=unclassified Pseudomonas TaxID=196821 RepID=UPI00117A19D3|nr:MULTISPECIES: hypothetical protein [unclassified Pseudomonas]MCU1730376.1 hypothetical protein [Pseudomonas sp. 20P_3.2_Bac4]MCU1746339.1 hypothetical protein [Pseudomonas sp. 20P_3.2_Bac5]